MSGLALELFGGATAVAAASWVPPLRDGASEEPHRGEGDNDEGDDGL